MRLSSGRHAFEHGNTVKFQRMRVLGRDKLTDFVWIHREAEPWIAAWLQVVE